jgi:hypothetical protein
MNKIQKIQGSSTYPLVQRLHVGRGISKGMLLTIQNNTKQNMLAKFRNMMILTRYIIIKFFKEDSSEGIIECVWYSVNNRATPN